MLGQTAQKPVPPLALRVTCGACQGVLWSGVGAQGIPWYTFEEHLRKHVYDEGVGRLTVEVDAMVNL